MIKWHHLFDLISFILPWFLKLIFRIIIMPRVNSLNNVFYRNWVNFFFRRFCKLDVEGCDLRLAAIVVLASANHEITVHSPLIAIWVPDYPVRHVLFLVMAPADDVDWVIEWLMGHLWILAIFCLNNHVRLLFGLFIWIRIGSFLVECWRLFYLNEFVITICFRSLSIVGRVVFLWLPLALDHDAWLVNLEIIAVCFEFRCHRSVVEHFLLNLKDSWIKVIAIYIIAIS